MNLLLQRGVCMSPPFPKTETVCINNQTTDFEGYNYEMHSFEYIDYTKHNLKSDLQTEYQLRYQRIKNCTHNWNEDELKVIMKNVTEMGSGW